MKSLKYIFSIAALTGALTLSASATFIIDPNPGGVNLFKQVDQIEFSGAGVRVPESGSTAMLLGGALAGLASIGLVRRYLKR